MRGLDIDEAAATPCSCGLLDLQLLRARDDFSPLTGHLLTCPVHKRIVAKQDPTYTPKMVGFFNPADQPEDHTTQVWIWIAARDGHSFTPFVEAEVCAEVSVPIGWSLASQEYRGVVLVNVFGETLTAGEAFMVANQQCSPAHRGFRVRQERRIGPANVGA